MSVTFRILPCSTSYFLSYILHLSNAQSPSKFSYRIICMYVRKPQCNVLFTIICMHTYPCTDPTARINIINNIYLTRCCEVWIQEGLFPCHSLCFSSSCLMNTTTYSMALYHSLYIFHQSSLYCKLHTYVCMLLRTCTT